MSSRKALLIRFSSIGDVVQCLSVATRLKEYECEVHWITRSDLESIAHSNPHVDKVWSLNRKDGLFGLFRLIRRLQKENFSHVYDAHNNLRSNLITMALSWPFNPISWKKEILFLKKPKYRWRRFLLFNFHINRFEKPFSGQRDLLEALEEWGLSKELPPPPQLLVNPSALSDLKKWLEQKNFPINFVALCPSASYELKRWPLKYWKDLIALNPDRHFLVLGGKDDHFVKELARPNVLIAAGELSLAQSMAAVSLSQIVISNDTGLLHVAEQVGKKAVALMGPAPFGFPSRPATTILERDLPCRPCSKHGQKPCRNSIHHQCMMDILPTEVSAHMNRMILS